MKVLGKYGESLIPKMSDDFYYSHYLKALQPFTIEQMNILGECGESVVLKMSSEAYYYSYFLEKLLSFTVEQLKVLGKCRESLIPKMSEDGFYIDYLEALQLLSVEQMEALGRRNALIFFQDVIDQDRAEFIQKNLINLTPKEIEQFVQVKKI
jgi:hypothetical protein